MSRPTPGWIKPLLLVLGLLITAANFLVFTDWKWFQQPTAGSPAVAVGPQNRDDRLRESVFLVKSADCAGQGESYGTAFAVAPGYLVTAAHVVSESHLCNSSLRVVDSRGLSHSALLEGYAEERDLALLRVEAVQPPQLQLAKSESYETPNQAIQVYTLGYPLVDRVSREDQASFSNVGIISNYDQTTNRFVTSGINLNPGNSGGPILLEAEKRVLGVAVSSLPNSIGEGISYVVPSDDLRTFFRDKTGQELP